MSKIPASVKTKLLQISIYAEDLTDQSDKIESLYFDQIEKAYRIIRGIAHDIEGKKTVKQSSIHNPEE